MQIHLGDTYACLFEGCSSKSNTQYGINHHFKKKHGQVKHRPGHTAKDPSNRTPCELCGFRVKSGNSAAHSMKLHMENHKSQIAIDCPINTCSTQIFTARPSYSFPLPLYDHIENVHGVDFGQLIVNFTCKICSKTVIGKHQGSKVSFAEEWKTSWG